jgi:hypothetical protein
MELCKEKMSAGLVCYQWSRVLYISSIYSHLTVRGDSMCTWRYVVAMQDYEVIIPCSGSVPFNPGVTLHFLPRSYPAPFHPE